MANITGMKEVLEAEQRAISEPNDEESEVVEEVAEGKPPPVLSTLRKRGRRLTQLESDEEGDESEEYKASE
jgi:hypothetical protein